MTLQSATNRTKALIFTRSTMAPEISAGVITANMPWNSMKATCGMVGASEASGAAVTPFRPA
jgi:hypothetical protein